MHNLVKAIYGDIKIQPYRDILFWNVSIPDGAEFCQAGWELIRNLHPLQNNGGIKLIIGAIYVISDR